MSKNYQQAQPNPVTNPAQVPEEGVKTGEKPTYQPPVEKESFFEKAKNYIVEFGNKHPKVRKWSRRIGKVTFIGGVAYGGFKIGQHYPLQNDVPVVEITSGTTEPDDEQADDPVDVIGE